MREEIAEAGVELLRSRFDVDVDGESDLASIIGRYDAIVIRSATKLTADLIAAADNLKVIGRAGVGVDNVDVDAATRRGIVVANAPESNIISAAEHTVGLLVALARNIPQAHAALVEGRWERSKWGGVELAEKTLGVLGFGRIGQQVARRAVGLQMRVVAYDPFVSADRFRELGVESDTFDGCSSGPTSSRPPAPERRDARRDRRRRDREDEGRRAHRQRRARRARRRGRADRRRSSRARSPAPRSTSSRRSRTPARCSQAPNIVVTPHLAASTDEAQDRAGVIVAEQVVAALEGGLVTNAVNIPSVGAEDLEVLGPYVPLAASLGRLALELARGEPSQISLEYHGELAEYDTRLLTVAALNGAFRGRVDQPVNYVNAPLIAAERGIEVVEERRRASRDFTNLIAVGGRRRPRRGHDDRHREPPVARPGARLRAGDRAGAAHDLPPLRRRPRRDRPRRHAARRGRRQHREHDRLAESRGRQGADGALDRHARLARGAREPRRGRRRRVPRRQRPAQ